MKLYILRGIPGSGKSTWAKNNHPDAAVVSADHHFINSNGEYHYKPKETGLAHQKCYNRFCELVHQQFHTVIVDNTNTTLSEVDRYLQTGLDNGYKVTILNFYIPPELSFQRNTHNVPKDVIDKMHQRFVSSNNNIKTACKTWGAKFELV